MFRKALVTFARSAKSRYINSMAWQAAYANIEYAAKLESTCTVRLGSAEVACAPSWWKRTPRAMTGPTIA